MDWKLLAGAYAATIIAYTTLLKIAAPSASPFVSAFIIEATAVITLAPFFISNYQTKGMEAVALLAAAGVALGLGRAAYAAAFSDSNTNLSLAGVSANLAITIGLAVTGIILLGENASPAKAAGIGLGCIGLYLLLT